MTEYREHGRPGWAIALGVVLLSVAVGLVAYNAGLSHGLAQTAIAAQGQVAPGGNATPPSPVLYPYGYPYGYAFGWHRPFVFGWIFPLLWLGFLLLLFRRIL